MEYLKEYPGWLTEEAKSILDNGYLLPGTTPLDTYTRVASTVASYMSNNNSYQQDVLHVLYSGWLGLASPVFANFGTDRGLPISCYSISIDDTLEAIFSHTKEVSQMESNGGAVGVYIGDIRGAGQDISGGGQSSGILPVINIYDKIFNYVSQGGVRRGSGCFYLPIDHDDIDAFLASKSHFGDPRKYVDSNIGVCIPNNFMNKVLNGDSRATETWSKVLETQMKSGSPYLFFNDNVNNASPAAYKNNNLKVKSSNLCFTGDTLVSVVGNSGQLEYIEIEKLEGKTFMAEASEYYQGSWQTVYQKSTAFSTGYCHVIEITLADGSTFRCTPEHQLALSNGEWVEAQLSKSKELANGVEVVCIVDYYDTEKVYDLNVPDFHCFYINTGSTKVLVHNCTEITGFTDEDHSFVCDLSSLNIAKYDEWKDWVGATGLNLPELTTVVLDAVMEEFINKAGKLPSMGRAVRFAKKGRMIGTGVMGLAYYYQKQGWAFKSYEAREFNKVLFKYLKESAVKASRMLAGELGEPEWCQGTGMRNTHLSAVAPTRTNSVLAGAFSAGVEPITSNIFVAKEAKGGFVRKNKQLELLLESKNKNTEEVWESIIKRNGSVIHLDFLTFDEKQVFFTAREISQMEIVRQACERQPFIDQAQSINRFYHPDTPISELNRHVFAAWANGLKTLYYTKSSSDSALTEVKNEVMIVSKPDCPYCDKAKKLMKTNNIKYVEHKLEGIDKFCFKTVPQIWYQAHYVGGYEQFEQLLTIQKKNMGVSRPDVEIEECESCEA